MLDFVVNGTVAANGPRPAGAPASDAQAELAIQDATATLVSVRDNAYDVIKDALGEPPMVGVGMSGDAHGGPACSTTTRTPSASSMQPPWRAGR